MEYKKIIKEVENFPKDGISFKDLTPLMQDGKAFKKAILQMSEFARHVGAEVIVGPEARGFIFGCPMACELEIGFIPVRKKGKLPRETLEFGYDLEYGNDTLSIHKDAIKEGEKVIIVDDLLATGGTILAVSSLIESLGGIVVGAICMVELLDLNGQDKFKFPVYSIVKY